MQKILGIVLAQPIKLLRIAALPLFFFLLNIVFIIDSTYQRFYHLDSIMHISGGFVVALAVRSFFKLIGGHFSRKDLFFEWLVLISITSLVAVVWELGEFVVDFYFSIGLQDGVADTMLDLFLGLVGAGFVSTYHLFRE